MSASTTLLPFQPSRMSTAEFGGGVVPGALLRPDRRLVRLPAKQWFAWCEHHGLDPLAGIERAHVELYSAVSESGG